MVSLHTHNDKQNFSILYHTIMYNASKKCALYKHAWVYSLSLTKEILFIFVVLVSKLVHPHQSTGSYVSQSKIHSFISINTSTAPKLHPKSFSDPSYFSHSFPNSHDGSHVCFWACLNDVKTRPVTAVQAFPGNSSANTAVTVTYIINSRTIISKSCSKHVTVCYFDNLLMWSVQLNIYNAHVINSI